MQFSSFSAALSLSPASIQLSLRAAAFPFVVCGCLIDINFPLGGREALLLTRSKSTKTLIGPLSSPRLAQREREGGREAREMGLLPSS